MRVGHLICWNGAGSSSPIQPLIHSLHQPPNILINVFTVAGATNRFDSTKWHPVPVVEAPPGFATAKEIDIALAERDIELLHLHGLRASTSIICRRWSDATGKPYLISPHGALPAGLAPRSAWLARLAGLLWEDALLAEASCMHAADDREARGMRALGIRAPICIAGDATQAEVGAATTKEPATGNGGVSPALKAGSRQAVSVEARSGPAADLAKAYRWLLDGGPRPACVHVD